jgi:hypothetical protein
MVALVVVFFSGYAAIWRPYVMAPRQDRIFLEGMPTENELMRKFGIPAETIHAGGKFNPTGWQPLPEKIASDTSFSFVRSDGRKIYIFISTNRVIEMFVISRS